MYSQISANKRKSVILLLLSLAVLTGLGYVFSQISGYGATFVLPVAMFAVVLNLGSYFAGDKIALAVSGARQIQKEDNPYVFRLVENLCITAGLPMPKIYLIPDPAMNAFATGRNPQSASIALTTGIIEGLQNEELEGVIAHELSHVQNYDIRFMMLVVVSIGAIALLADMFLRSMWFGGRHRDREGNNSGASVLAIVGIVLAILAPIIGQLIKFAVSRRREYLADASGALLTRYPAGLASALEKIQAQAQPMQRPNEATAHLFLSNPFGSSRSWHTLFATHPPIADRIQSLRNMTL